jgi:phage gpG-like protein
MMRPASGQVSGTAMVGVTAVYAAIQEFGGKTWPNHSKFMHWVNSGGSWYMKEVTIPPHPYFRPTVDRMVRNGDLTREAKSAFWVRILPLLQG